MLAQGAGASITLLPGIEQAQLAPPHGFAMFTMPPGTFAGAWARSAEFDVVSTPLSGDVDVYVSVAGVSPAVTCAVPAPGAPGNCNEWAPVPGTYNYSSAAAAAAGVGGFVGVPVAALGASTPLVVGVLGTSPDGYFVAPPSLFTVVAQSAAAALRLNNGVPVSGIVGPTAVRTYNFTFYSSATDVVLAAEFSTGSLDLFASATIATPGPGANTWNSTARGGFLGRRRLLYIGASDLAAACPAAATAGCTIWLAVVGSASMAPGVVSAYTVSATLSGNPAQPAPLVQGTQVLTEVLPNSAVYFAAQVNIDPSQALYVMATDVSAGGQLSLYASLGPGASPPCAANGWAANATSTDLGGYSRLILAPGSPLGGYCSSCPMYVTLRSMAQARSDVGLLFRAGPAFQQLADGQVTPTVLNGANDSALFSFGVEDPLADVVFTFNEVSGTVIAYIGVVSPARPYRVPNIQFHQYTVQPSVGGGTLTIAKGDPNRCKTPDGLVTGVPCTYVIGVYPTDPSAGQTLFSVVATADATGGLIQLVDGVQTDGAVGEGAFTYYIITPGPGVAPIVINAAAYSGAVAVYVTNAYIPGQSAPGLLPGPGVGCWSSRDRAPLVIAAGDPCLSPSLPTYTIAVQGASGVPQYMAPFHIAAAFNQPLQTLKLELGVPITNVAVAQYTNAYFTFDLPSTANDVVITASPLLGTVSVAVSKHGFAAATDPPACSSTGGSVNAYCVNYVWLATGIAGASAMRVSSR